MRVVSLVQTFSDEKGGFSDGSSVLIGEWDCWRCGFGVVKVGRLLWSTYVH